MLPLIHMFHDDGSQVDMRGGNSQYREQYTGITLISLPLSTHRVHGKMATLVSTPPSVSKFLDPHHMFMQNAATVLEPLL
jgi:hypothetical protein